MTRRLLAAAILLCLATGVGVSQSMDHTVERKDLSAHQVVEHYYDDLQQGDARAAFSLLCPGQQLVGVDAFVKEASEVVAVTSWKQKGADLTDRTGHRAVTGRITLADGFTSAEAVIVTHDALGWSVCGTNFGGVLPYDKGTPPPASATI